MIIFSPLFRFHPNPKVTIQMEEKDKTVNGFYKGFCVKILAKKNWNHADFL